MNHILLFGIAGALVAVGWLCISIAVALMHGRGCTRKSWLDQDVKEMEP